ncbi:Vps5-domain-containing protein [Atractiella rhizophila]|nr:Vps5-domain-containing protein [Atractiella rhizophila]
MVASSQSSIRASSNASPQPIRQPQSPWSPPPPQQQQQQEQGQSPSVNQQYQQQNFYIPPSPHAPTHVPNTRGPPSYTSEQSFAPSYATHAHPHPHPHSPVPYRQQANGAGHAHPHHAHPAAAPQILQQQVAPPPAPQQQPIQPAKPRPKFVIRVGDPQKVGAAINPMSGHTVYTVRTQTNSTSFKKPEFSVLRRYKEFVWLYEQLLEDNPGVMVPQLPEKQAMGQFDAEFVENRRHGLQDFLERCTSHPILYEDNDLRLFLESDTLSMDAERDGRRTSAMGVGGAGLLGMVGSVVGGAKFIEFDEFFDERRNYLDSLESQLKSLHETLVKCSKSRLVFTSSLSEMEAIYLNISDCDLSSTLKGVFAKLSKLQQRLRIVGEEQAKKEDEGLSVLVEGYVRQIGSARLSLASRVKAFQAHQAAEQTLSKAKRNHEKLKAQGIRFSEQLDQAWTELVDAERRAQSFKAEYQEITRLVKSEILRFDQEKIEDFKMGLEEFVNGMVDRQKEIVAAWEVYLDEAREAQDKILGVQRPPAPLSAQEQQQQLQAQKAAEEEERRREEEQRVREEEEERERQQRSFAEGLSGGGLANPW